MNTKNKNFLQHVSAWICLLLVFPVIVNAQSSPSIEWQKCLGGTSMDYPLSFIRTFDGGYLVEGPTGSMDGDVTGFHTDTTGTKGYRTADTWIVKLTSSGNIEWTKCIGGKGEDRGYIIQTSDSGYIFAGWTDSRDGDVSGLHIDTSVDKVIRGDAWIVKLSPTGNIEWKQTLGGTGPDGATSIIESVEGGYAFVAGSASNDGDVARVHRGQIWFVKLSVLGAIEWQKSFGGWVGQDMPTSLIQTTDSGYAILSRTTSTDGDVVGQHATKIGNVTSDIWVIKLDRRGSAQWFKCLGGSRDEYPGAIIQSSDKGFVVTGTTQSNDGDVTGHHHPDTTVFDHDTVITGKDNSDAWVVKLDTSGNIQWQKSFGGFGDDGAGTIFETPNNGYIFLGITNSTDGDVSGLHGTYGYDVWLVKLNFARDIMWQKCFGGTKDDYPGYLLRTSDNGYAFAASTVSNDGDVSGHHNDNGSSDIWVVKLSAPSIVNALPSSPEISLNLVTYPNPAKKTVTLDFDLLKSSAVSATLYTITGDQILQTSEKTEQRGHHQMPIDVSSLAEGSYIINFTADGLSEKKIIQIVR